MPLSLLPAKDPMASVLPFMAFSLPSLKSTQLSFLLMIFLFLLPVVKRGESREGQVYFSSMISSSIFPPSSEVKQGCLTASFAVILSLGDFLSIFSSRLRASSPYFMYSSPLREMAHALFWDRISSQVLPGKADFPNSRMWKMIPILNMSQIGWYFVFMSLMLITQGATYPGVPQRTNRYSSASQNSASPKSAMTQSKLFSVLKMRFSGLRSLCMIFFSHISLTPCKMPNMMVLISWGLNLYLSLIFSCRFPPSSSSNTIQREFYVSKISCRLMLFLWVSSLMISISLMRHSLPFSSLQAASLEKALTAYLVPSSCFWTRQTVAKLPLPIFLMALNCSWKPLWLILTLRAFLHSWRSVQLQREQVSTLSSFSNFISKGEVVKLNLMSNSYRNEDSLLECPSVLSIMPCSQIDTQHGHPFFATLVLTSSFPSL